MIKTENRSDKPPGYISPARNTETLIDRQHLSDFAMGDPALERRFLQLFLDHAGTDLKRMADAGVEPFQKAAHSLKSSASSIGAWFVVDYLEQILEMPEHVLGPRRDEVLRQLSDRIEETVGHIRHIMDHE